MHQLINADCLDYLRHTDQIWDTIFADPPDNIGLKYANYKDKLPDEQYVDSLSYWLSMFVLHAKTVWFSFNAKWTFEMGRIALQVIGRHTGEVEVKPCVQTFSFGQHRHDDLGNNHRPLWRFRWRDAPLLPDAIRVQSWRQANGDKRADPRGRVPGDVDHCEIHGRDTLPLPNWNADDIERFLSKIIRVGASDCWEWTASKREGYGRFRIGEHLYVATRLMWRLTHGVDPIGQLVLHACDNPGCCNPNHLFLGTDEDNNNDKETKQRGKHPKGENTGSAKLTTEEIIAIYQSAEGRSELGRKYGVTEANIRAIQEGQTWQHVTRDLPLSDVFNIPRVTGNSKQRRTWHPTQIHEGLIERCIRLTTPVDGTVLDPFAGTGTTLRVCKRLNTPCTLIEVDPTYCEKIAEEHDLLYSATDPYPVWISHD